MIKRIRILILSIFILSVSCIGGTAVFAGTSSNASVTVYVTISNDSDFVQGTDGTVMAHVPFTVEYFDLAEYGLEKYYRYDDDDNLIEEPTVLHLLIRVLERYYAMRTIDREGDMHSDVIDVTGAAKSLWLNRFWGHDGNLMYFVNHMYPLMSEKWGATADYILLNDGDDVDLAMYTDYSFYNNSAFLYFDQSTVSAKTERPIELQLLAKPTAVVNDGVDRDSIPMQNETIRVSSDRGITWSQMTEKTDADGMISLTFDSSGTYYVATGPSHTNYTDASPAICVVTVRDVTPEEQALIDAKQAAINDLQNYTSSDLYREAEQMSLASIIQSGTASINTARTVSAVQTAYNNAISQINALKTKAQYEAEEQGQGGEDDPDARALAESKTNAKSELSEYAATKEPELYRNEQKEELAQALEQGNAAIDAAQTVEDVAQALGDAKAALDAVKTDEQMKQEEQEEARQLAEAKNNAKLELGSYMAPEEYRDAEKALLLEILSTGNAAIDAAETKEEVTALLAEYKGKIDALKTDAEYTREEEGARKEQEEKERKEREEAERKAREAAIKKAKAAKTTVKVTALKKHRAKVTWKKVTLSYAVDDQKYSMPVTGYKVYRATKKNGKYKLIKTVKKAGTLNYTDKKLKKGKKYFYKVRTYTVIYGTTYLGKWSKVKAIRAK